MSIHKKKPRQDKTPVKYHLRVSVVFALSTKSILFLCLGSFSLTARTWEPAPPCGDVVPTHFTFIGGDVGPTTFNIWSFWSWTLKIFKYEDIENTHLIFKLEKNPDRGSCCRCDGHGMLGNEGKEK